MASRSINSPLSKVRWVAQFTANKLLNMFFVRLHVDEYWMNHPELHEVPIYYASSLAKKCMSVYQTYVNAMNDKIKKQIAISNPFVFKHISNLKVSSIFSINLENFFLSSEYKLEFCLNFLSLKKLWRHLQPKFVNFQVLGDEKIVRT